VKVTRNIFRRHSDRERGWPGYLFGGHVRTSTVVLILAFLAVWWVYDTYHTYHTPAPTTQVVPPGFVPDPNYTWVPRSRVQQPPATITVTPTPTTAPVTTTSPPPFVLPTLPCLPPFCTTSTTPITSPSQLPQPGPGPTPTSSPPAR
jgi:hypothetical protein